MQGRKVSLGLPWDVEFVCQAKCPISFFPLEVQDRNPSIEVTQLPHHCLSCVYFSVMAPAATGVSSFLFTSVTVAGRGWSESDPALQTTGRTPGTY